MKAKSQDKSTNVRTRRTIINLLKQEGAIDSKELSSRLGISAMAVRQHLYALQAEGLVTYKEEARKMGRPAKLWQLTPAADRFFPDGYAELTVSLINSINEIFGEVGLDRLLELRTKEQILAYRSQIDDRDSLAKRLEQLALLRTAEGYMARIQSLKDGSFLLIENHCPICAAAMSCTGLCAKELEVFQQVLGENVTIERKEHIIEGARRCTYSISQG